MITRRNAIGARGDPGDGFENAREIELISISQAAGDFLDQQSCMPKQVARMADPEPVEKFNRRITGQGLE